MQLFRHLPDRDVWVGSFAELGPDRYMIDFSSGHVAPVTTEDLAGLSSAVEIDVHAEDVSFTNGDVRLAGKLARPEGRGPFPGVVLIHGSNDQDRDALDPWVGFFASRGLAVLSYDKRGVRESTGEWKTSDLQDLAADALSGVEFLRREKVVDPRRIGLFGISQGGWIAPLAAATDKSIAFIILHAGAALPVVENNLRFIEAELRGYNFPSHEIAQALDYYRLNDDVTRDPTRWDELKAAFDSARARKVEWLLEEPLPVDSWYRSFYRRIMDFDPAAAWGQVECPVLAFFGERDTNVVPEPNSVALRKALKRETLDRSTIVLLPEANHLFLRAKTGTRDEYARLTHFVGGYWSEMGTWLAQTVGR